MWEKNKNSWYKWDNDKLVGSIIYHPQGDKNWRWYSVQIHPMNGGIICIGKVPGIQAEMNMDNLELEKEFDARPAQAIIDLALSENKDFEWWQRNYRKWWNENTVYT